MPETPLTPDKRRIQLDPDTIDPPPRAPFVELGLMSCFTFLRGASDAVDLGRNLAPAVSQYHEDLSNSSS